MSTVDAESSPGSRAKLVVEAVAEIRQSPTGGEVVLVHYPHPSTAPEQCGNNHVVESNPLPTKRRRHHVETRDVARFQSAVVEHPRDGHRVVVEHDGPSPLAHSDESPEDEGNQGCDRIEPPLSRIPGYVPGVEYRDPGEEGRGASSYGDNLILLNLTLRAPKILPSVPPQVRSKNVRQLLMQSVICSLELRTPSSQLQEGEAENVVTARSRQARFRAGPLPAPRRSA
jgi:hypothetical protein